MKIKNVLLALLFTFIFLVIVALTVLVIIGFMKLYDKYPNTMDIVLLCIGMLIVVGLIFIVIFAYISDMLY